MKRICEAPASSAQLQSGLNLGGGGGGGATYIFTVRQRYSTFLYCIDVLRFMLRFRGALIVADGRG